MEFGLAYNIIMACKVIIFFILIYIFIPAQITKFKKDDTLLDKIFISFTHSHIITILLVHVLVFMKLYETFSIIFVYLLVYAGYSWIRGRSPVAVAEALGMGVVVKMLDISEGRYGLGGELIRYAKKWIYISKTDFLKFLRNFIFQPFSGILVFTVFVVACVIRAYHSIIHSYYACSDPYVHLAWVKYLGFNEMYRDGIYCHGFQAIISAMCKLTFIDPYYIIRFLGPMTAVFLLLSIYYFAVKNLKNHYVGLVAVFIYGIYINNWFGFAIWRQMSALPQEYAAIFLLPGLHFFSLYIQNKTKRHLLLAGETFALSILIHPYVAIPMAICYIIMYLCYPANLLNMKELARISAMMVLSLLVGVWPIVIGLLMGKSYYNMRYVTENMSTLQVNALSGQVLFFTEKMIYIYIIIVCVGLMLLYSTVLHKRINVSVRPQTYFFPAVASMVLLLQYYAKNLGLPQFMAPDRISVTMAILVPIICGMPVILIDLFGNQKVSLNIYRGAAVIAIFSVMVLSMPVRIPKGEMYEYDQIVNAYLRIKDNYPSLNWTIVSPVEQYQEVLGFGYHYDLFEFAQNVARPEKDGDVLLTIPTDYVFFFIEKIPLGLGREINKGDFEKEIPKQVGPATEFYYRKPENRAILEAKVINWADEFSKKNAGMSVFYEDDQVKIYMLKQDGAKPLNLIV